MASIAHLLTRRLTRPLSKRLDTTFGFGSLSGAATLLGSETAGVALDFRDLSALVRDTVTPANNFAGDVNSWLTYTSPSTKWILGSNGLYSSDTTLRTEYSASGAALGLLVELAATNLFLNSRSPATQVVTTAATSYTISGVGAPGATITLTGTGTGTLTGTGAVDRDKLTVSCTAGALLLTVAGAWDFVQVESGTIATSPIVTAGSTVTRAVDVITKAVSAFALGSQHSMFIDVTALTQSGTVVSMGAVSAAGASLFYVSGDSMIAAAYQNFATQALMSIGVPVQNTAARAAARFASNDFAARTNLGTIVTDGAGTVPAPATVLRLGGNEFGGAFGAFHIRRVMILPRGISNAEIGALVT